MKPRPRTLFLVLACALWATVPGRSEPPDEYAAERAALLAELTRYGKEEAGPGGFSERVLAVLAEIPRHAFVAADQRRHAWRNRPLPIGHGQTISQPYIVALMTDLVAPQPEDVILDCSPSRGCMTVPPPCSVTSANASLPATSTTCGPQQTTGRISSISSSGAPLPRWRR